MVLAACVVALITVRTLFARGARTPNGIARLTGVERSVSRMIGLTTALTAVAAIWWGSGLLQQQGIATVSTAAGGTGFLAGVFAWASKWLSTPLKETRGSTLARVVLGWLKRATPRALALMVLVFLILQVGTGVRSVAFSPVEGAGGFNREGFGWLMGVSGAVLLLTAWLFDPARVGLHEFYRSRISRCYLGASNSPPAVATERGAAGNRYVSERPGDDLKLGAIRKASVKPIHLVCTAANDLAGDHLATLYRGARSAVLSANGISIGDKTGRLDYLGLSAALTASAAAFNSQMGRVSMDLGPAVAFLMGALNLRLGLWVPHPENPRRDDYTFPGRLFLRELFGRSRTDGSQLHLSDGNHFENFGLYELVRRHCRSIIVSDCGADPAVSFDDLANVLRRVREDFGVEIELDIAPLRPAADGLARQHAVAGTIHYDGLDGSDKGTLLFFKPALTGDEPPDVLQYRTKNGQFPHETTGDQFYDEAQWESYRRLGEHAVRTTLGFAESIGHEKAAFLDRLFLGVRERLHPAAEGHREVFIAMSERCASLEADVFSQGPSALRRELFPEVVALRGQEQLVPDLEQELQAVSYLMRAIQIMEDVWVAADLERYWSHPLNEGWMNYFQRWASAPTFRRWWPILRPIYSNGFRDFAAERFGLGMRDALARPDSDPAHASVRLRLMLEPSSTVFEGGHAWRQFVQRAAAPDLLGRTLLVYRMDLLNGTTRPSPTLDVGFALVDERPVDGGRTATWQAEHFFVPPPLIGAGIVGRQLDAVIAYYTAQARVGGFRRLTVVFGSGVVRPRGKAARDERVRQIGFFKSRGFEVVASGDLEPGRVELSLTLPPPA
ncbi:MAG: hypothetical protein HY824_16885 [Acidobacteria bacterium]|nr:hypothetical protein [Acidobacteriota bacterium]